MTKTVFSLEQRQAYFKSLRDEWKANKEKAENDTEARARFEAMLNETGGQFSYYSYYFTLLDMRALGLAGSPYIDTKTFNKWREAGFKVKKGEKSKIRGIVWMHPITKKENGESVEDDSFLYPKVYHLFHSSQVEAL